MGPAIPNYNKWLILLFMIRLSGGDCIFILITKINLFVFLQWRNIFCYWNVKTRNKETTYNDYSNFQHYPHRSSYTWLSLQQQSGLYFGRLETWIKYTLYKNDVNSNSNNFSITTLELRKVWCNKIHIQHADGDGDGDGDGDRDGGMPRSF